MLEDTPTLGSVEAPVTEKKRLATQSLPFNLKNNAFCDLFPELTRPITDSTAATTATAAAATDKASNGCSVDIAAAEASPQQKPDYSRMSVRELKAEITRQGLDMSSCVEKLDLVQLLDSSRS